MHLLEDYDYTLPEHLIAQTLASPPESCRLLVYEQSNKNISHHIFSDITDLIDDETLLVFNNTKVVKARLIFHEYVSDLAKEPEIFYLSSIDAYTFHAFVAPGKKFPIWWTISFNKEISFTIDKLTHEWRILTCSHPILEVLDTYGQMPLPPYIDYNEEKAAPYQPIFAENEWSVATPTASLHFSKELLSKLHTQWIQTAFTTLHIWLGTFKQVDVEAIEEYAIHDELCVVDISLFERLAAHKLKWKPILAVWTTVTRTLESLPYVWKSLRKSSSVKGNNISVSKEAQDYRNTLTQDISVSQAAEYIQNITIHKNNWSHASITFSTKLFLYPGKPLHIIDELITNFHWPKSTLLMLVAAFIGFDEMKHIYKTAIEHAYRFYSFGDAMWLK